MKIRILVFFVIAFFTPISKAQELNENYEVVLEIKHIYQGEGFSLTYLITKDSLYVNKDCQQINCKNKVVYKQYIQKEQVEELEHFLEEINTDTLVGSYQHPIEDGLLSIYKWKTKKGDIKLVEAHLNDIDVLNNLMEKINALIEKKKFRFK